MKKLIIIMVLLMANTAMASPFLVCDSPDPADEVTSYVITYKEREIETLAPLHYDLQNIPEGDYNISVQAKNRDGVSVATPFFFERSALKLPVDSEYPKTEVHQEGFQKRL